jgi:hypothetical protein
VSEKNTGGPAFPGPDQQEQRENIHEGMTLRDYFAAKAMMMFANELDPNLCADMAYQYADAMLRARDA